MPLIDRLRIIGIATVRNEGDIIGQSLRHAARLYDLILVVDGGSWDDTLARVREVSVEHPHVVLLGTVEDGYAETLRRHIFARFARHLPPAAWWGIADADEFPADNLRAVVATAHREFADHVRFEMAQFFVTRQEAREGRASAADRHRPIQERRRAYIMDHSWRRLFRNLPWLRWNTDRSWPERLVRWGSERLEIRHYQYRDLEQMQLRQETRARLALDEAFKRMHPHWTVTRLEQMLMDESDPRLRWAVPGEPLVHDPQMPVRWVPRWGQSAMGYTRAMLGRFQRQRAAELLGDVDVEAVLHCMRPVRATFTG